MRLVNTANSGGEENRTKTAKSRREEGVITAAGEDEEGCRTVCYSPARVVVYRLLAIARKCRSGGRREKVQISDEFSPEISRRKSDDRRRINVSGLQSQEMSFNLAAGLGLLSLIAASKTELDKTVELRKQMEVFLESFKEGNQSKGTTPKPSDSDNAYAVSTTIDNLSNYSVEDHALSQQGSGNTCACALHCDIHQKEEFVEGINHLEAELAAELDRMQLDVDAGGYVETGESSDLQQEVTEIPSENTAIGSVSMSTGEVIDPQYVDNTEFCGVPPLELERRLHEVLETRQEERIKELEAHLERMTKKLQEKEVEVTWWKDTAKLISKQVPESSRAMR
ncbi:protein POLAR LOCALIZATION DURING ASYMMETRIC DIVISION AND REDISTRIBUTION-like isoform X2 [Chenopodium quinoa]|uniref:protein POLAR LOCALIZATION DURING ASYMMETRIC DIVISION AND REDISTRIBUTION-like isoform X1 n=1 Tax=Chenopodium quinoa TaxID=63459 RepID=UPI000B77F9FA|nr:protein POLAR LOCALIZATION DURING ASYMMETRIC DIVISION AND REDISTRIBUTION-like isoform X1 [Chenopodium quinoa]XP_021738178.1 protein POLAR LOCALIZATION DURING ASYMMETRIC DIVISION AND REDISTRIBUTION-like isoform X2 [Chenopodium quinoa]